VSFNVGVAPITHSESGSLVHQLPLPHPFSSHLDRGGASIHQSKRPRFPGIRYGITGTFCLSAINLLPRPFSKPRKFACIGGVSIVDRTFFFFLFEDRQAFFFKKASLKEADTDTNA